MSKSNFLRVSLFLTVLLVDRPLFATMVVFDFDDIHSQANKRVTGASVEAYMEGLFGAQISVSQNTTASNSMLRVGRGKGGPGITIDFGDNPIDSFSVDFHLFKRAKNFTILADGAVINQQSLSKAQRQLGMAGHQSDYFFDTPVETLQFIGLRKKSFAIDNLVINIPADDEPGGEGPLDNPGGSDIGGSNNLTAEIPEPSSLLMLAAGLCGAWFGRRALRG